MSFITSRAKSFTSGVSGIILGIVLIGGIIMLLGFAVMFVGLGLYITLNYINTNVLGLGDFGITALQYSFLAFNIGIFMLIGPFGVLVWFLASLWNPAWQGLYDVGNLILAVIWGIFSDTAINYFTGQQITHYLFGPVPQLTYIPADTTNWVDDYIKIGSFIKELLLPNVSICFWDPSAPGCVAPSSTPKIALSIQQFYYKLQFFLVSFYA